MSAFCLLVCLALTSVCGALAAIPESTGQVLTFGRGTGELCEGGRRFCLEGDAVCLEDKCVCKFGSGRGDFLCHGKYEKYGIIYNDPIAITYGGERFPVLSPCRYLLSHEVTDLHTQHGQKYGDCNIQVFSYNGRAGGKFFASGVEIYATMLPALGKTRQYSVRMTGYGKDGVYWFQVWSKPHVRPGDWRPRDVPYQFEAGVEVLVDRPNNRICFIIRPCGFYITFRPADVSLGKDQTQIPGIAVVVNTYHNPIWLSPYQILLLPTITPELSVARFAEFVDMPPDQAFLYRALSIGAHQDFPWAPESCPFVVATARACTDDSRRKQAFKFCTFILATPKFVHCWSGDDLHSSERVVKLFGQCLDAFCQGMVEKCQMVVRDVGQSECARFVSSGLDGFDCNF